MDERDFLRHLLATLAYRGGKCLRGAPASFARYDTGDGKTPLAILSHISDLLDWTLSMVQGEKKWQVAVPGTWDAETARFHAALERLDERLTEPFTADWERLVHGPLADALTHVGQLAILRRMAGAPLPGESYYAAEITTGRVGADQAAPRKPF